MLTREGYKLLFSLPITPCKIGLYLIGHFDLRKWKCIERKWDTRDYRMTTDALVEVGLFEYGPAPRPLFGNNEMRTVRIRPELVMKPRDLQHNAWAMEACEERMSVVRREKEEKRQRSAK